MTIRQAYTFALIECNKLEAPSLLLEDYIYLFNKAIQQFINGVYNRCEFNQQSSDDLSCLLTEMTYDLESCDSVIKNNMNDTIWTVDLPKDYFHLLNCMVEFTGDSKSSKRCNNNSIKKKYTSNCQRLTADLYAGIHNNYYMKPSYKKPYYYIVNTNNSVKNITNDTMDQEIKIGSYKGTEIVLKDNYDRTVHQSSVKLQIHTGDNSKNSDGKYQYNLDKIYITYIKAPMYVSMTEEQIELEEDTTQVLEFPDYICYEIINIFVRLLLENAGDPRLQTNIPINQTLVAQ